MRRSVVLLLLFLLPVVTNGTAAAAPSKEERNLDREMSRLDRTTAALDGERAVIARITSDFNVPAARVQALRQLGLGYGETTVVLSLARTMPGGITDVNIQKVIALRQGPPVIGWGQVATQLGTKLGKTVSQVKKVNDESRREMKKDQSAEGQ